jgi:ribonuclease HI
MPNPRLIVHADGGIGEKQAGAGAILCTEKGEVLQLITRSLPLMTSNEAEYAGLILALELAAHYPQHLIEIRLDSEIVVYQMIGRFGVNSPKLKPLHRQACELSRSIPHLKLKHIRRESNRIADALAAEAAAGRSWSLCSGL